MIMYVTQQDGSWFIGRRGRREMGLPNHESQGCHHFTVLSGDSFYNCLQGTEIAVPICTVKCFVLNYKTHEIGEHIS